MRLVYIANVRLPTEKAHGVQIMQMCAAFASNGHEVMLIVPGRRNAIAATPWEYYGLKRNFRIVTVPVLDFIPFDRWLGNAALWLTTVGFAFGARRVVADARPDAVYSRDAVLVTTVPKGVPFVFEAHDFPTRPWLYRFLWKACSRIVTVTEGLKRAFIAAGVPETKLVVAHDAVDPGIFQVSESKAEARRALGLPTEGFIAVYSGHLYPYKGADDLLEACLHLRPASRVVFVGGRPEEVARLRMQAEKLGVTNAFFVGQVPHGLIPMYLRAADGAVLPTRDTDRHASEFLSPLKLFEYLAAGKAIVATDLPSIREVLDENTAVFVPPRSPEALAAALNGLADVPVEAERLSREAEALSRDCTWVHRAGRVLSGTDEPQPSLTWLRRHRAVLACMLLAFILRAAYVLAFPLRLAGGDGELYVGYADLLRGIPAWSPRMYAYFQPGYPIFLAVIRSLFGTDLVAVGLSQAVISALTVGLVTAMTRKLVGARAAVFAGLMSAVSASSIVETGQIYTETLYTFLLTAAVCALLVDAHHRAMRHAAIVGASFALAGFVRELALYHAALLAAVTGIGKRSWRPVVGIMAPVVVMLLVFGAYNRTVAAGQAVPRVPILAKGYEATLQDPASQAFLLRWRMYPLGLWYFFRYPHRFADISDQVSTRQALFSGDAALIGREAPYILAKGLLTLLHWMILVLAAYGLWRGRMPREAKIVISVTIAFAAATITLSGAARLQGFEYLEPLARYRFPVEPLIMILAAAGAERFLKNETT